MLDNVLIGSAAVNYHDISILGREAKDKDYLSLNEGFVEYDNDILISDVINGQGILEVPESYIFKDQIASLNEVYTLKVSHSPWVIDSRSWMKHLSDIRKLKDNGATLIPELHKLAYAQWEIRKGAKNVNLNQDKEEFFGNNVKRKYDHDSIHASVAFNENPMYMKILIDGANVKTSRKKFDKLSNEEKIMLVNEEVMVLSLERDLIPSVKLVDERSIYASYNNQLKMLITQYSKGWFPLWIIENYFSVAYPPVNYWEKFNNSDKKVLL